jgi:DNA-directed RNA polymerase specialized sigma24 family protein
MTETGDPLHALLTHLGGGRTAAAAYEALRRRLIAFFRLHVPVQADDLADAALDRLGRRLAEGVLVEDTGGYALGIARYLVREAQAQAIRAARAECDPLLQPPDEDTVADAVRHEAVLAALDACLDTADPGQGRLILDYYGADGGARIALRQRLAAALGISLNALRNRALRVREALEACVRGRLLSG